MSDEPRPSYSTNTEHVVPVIDETTLSTSLASLYSMENAWTAKMIAVNADNNLRIQVNVSANAIIGEWLLRIESKSRVEGDESKFYYDCKDPFYLIMNPWSKSNVVYIQRLI